MKECCSNCDYCNFNAEYVKPYKCTYKRPYKRFDEDFAYNNQCENWKHGELTSNDHKFAKELAMHIQAN